ncbi:methylglyoxal synthase [Ancylobacter dichloromethanicus]|uniref:Methylglyoxal synthase n=1 Tax=Ancylobacter dichloromethanicus TaxID=518825 RepID=A0A9W6J677_9HYPH|nr:methylglyoxal synthase [Ancylobacter dichloromethanicus]MBS7556210.1 methylglyoxal synthase [Ancylobacter dichloromethanicus]GLK69965.1 methylglyoxal synthase [Ancylobacter dichloromethanicus]
MTPGASLGAGLLGLVAHDSKKDEMVAWALAHRQTLARFPIVTTGTTGGRILDACPELRLTRLKSGPLGGDQQIGALIAQGQVRGLVFFVDPLTAQPHDVDVKALMRVALVYDIPLALNPATAQMLIAALRE